MREFRPRHAPAAARVAICLVMLAFLAIPLALAVGFRRSGFAVSYTISEGTLRVVTGDFIVGDRSAALRDVTGARVVTLSGGRRTMGTYLPGFCAGLFTYPDLGTVWQATDCSREALLLDVRGMREPLMITPPDVAAFQASLASGAATRVSLPPANKSPAIEIVMVALALALVTVSMTVAAMLLGPSRMRYVVEDGELRVRTIFGRRTLRLDGARARLCRPTTRRRLMGTAISGYYTGRFSIDGEVTRVYATNLDEGVLVEGTERLFLSPANPDGLLASLHAGGASVEGHHAGRAPDREGSSRSSS